MRWWPLVLLLGCRSEPAPAAGPDAEINVEFLDESFEQLYPLFLKREIPQGPKAALWQKYRRRFVRWQAAVVSFTPNGMTLKHLSQTMTFDVSLKMANLERDKAKALLKPRDLVQYTGRLDTYDDIFRTMYIVDGRIVKRIWQAPIVDAAARD